VNTQTLPVVNPMPDIDAELAKTRGSNFFGWFDLVGGYWQQEVESCSQEYYSFQTPWANYTPTRLPQGSSDSVLWFNQCLTEVFREEINEGSVCIWVDDILIHAKTFDEYITILKRVFHKLETKGLKVSIKKSTLIAPEAQWCGRIINAEGVKYHPRNYEAITKMDYPRTAGELNQLLTGMGWMQKCLPRFNEIKAPLKELMETVYEKCTGGNRKKKLYDKVDIRHMWTLKHKQSWDECKILLQNEMQNTHIIPGAKLCLMSDASDRFWNVLLTQVENWQEGKDVTEQDHRPVCTMSGEFTKSELNWSTIEKESYPIVQALMEWRYHLQNPNGFKVYCDHSNIVALFKPESIKPALGRASTEKIYRWLHLIAHFKIESFEHLKGQKNVWCDALSRFMNRRYYQKEIEETKHIFVKTLPTKKYKNFLKSQYDKNWEFPSTVVIKYSQELYMDEFKELFTTNDGKEVDQLITTDPQGLIYFDKKLWIPQADTELQQRLLIIAHAGPSGHRSIEDAIAKLEQHVWWADLRKDTKNFVNNCLCCEKVRGGDKRPVPWGETLHAKYRNEIISFDFMYIEQPTKLSPHNYKYVLVLKDEYSGFIELIPCEACTHEPVVEALAFWCSRYGRPRILRSDMGSHFKNKVVEQLAKQAGLHHHFTLPYTPHCNGSVEIVNRSIKKVLRTSLLEQNLKSSDWAYLLPMVMNVINGSISKRLDNLSPRQVYMGLPQFDPVSIIFCPHLHEKILTPKWSEQSVSVKEAFAELQEALNDMHQTVDASKLKVREAAHKAYRKKIGKPADDTNLSFDVDFRVGDYVLVAMPNPDSLRKLDAVWRGPYRVVGLVHSPLGPRAMDNRVYEVEHLITKVVSTSHAIRMKFYNDRDMDNYISFDSLTAHILNQEVSQYLPVERISAHRFDDVLKTMTVKCHWLGWEEQHATWEPLVNMHADVPLLVKNYLATLSTEAIKQLSVYLT
jgi:hypothetical protein